MACFCHKLRAENLSDIEAEVQGKDVSQEERPSDAIRDLAAVVSQLEETYPNEELEVILKSNTVHHRIQEVPPQFAAAVNIILAIEGSGQIIEVKQLSKRVYYYALTKLHHTQRENPSTRSWRKSLKMTNILSKRYTILSGGRLSNQLGLFSAIFWQRNYQKPRLPAFSVCVWERAPPEACSAAISALAKKDIYQRITTFRPFVNSALGHISDTHRFIIHSCDRNGTMKLIPMDRRLHTTSKAASHWKASFTTAMSAALPESEVTGLLLVLLCFLARSEVPLQLCVRGATPRKRWSEQDKIEETNALHTGLIPELVHAFSNHTHLNNALCELQSFSAISKKSDNACLLNPSILDRVLCSLSPDLHSFWRLQALIVAFRSVSWRYLEPGPLNMNLLITTPTAYYS
ncbi:hypothetical protein ACJ73_02990 [Blastomyces percursus]|uniref:Uncharacterized protein n=1 Tax=Blastomyces percursus TaxID=1658174 RepID=A0A1J9RD98_9EURO|nr:hypothetical protein ACJ73_02990 [Blastomyces percursus]